MSALKAAIRATWAYAIVLVGILLLTAICFSWAVISLLLNALLPAAAGRRAGRVGAMWCFRTFLGVMEALGAWRLELDELDALRDAGPLVIAPNHPCLLDAVLLVSRLPDAVCVMKGSLHRSFLLGPASRLARYVPNDSLARLITSAGEELKLGGQLLLFPEGTRSSAYPIGPFTDAVGALSRRTGVPVQAVIIEADQRFTGKGWTLASRPRLPLTYRVRVGRRYDPPRDVRAFTAELERYFIRELATRTAPAAEEVSRDPAVDDAQRLRG